MVGAAGILELIFRRALDHRLVHAASAFILSGLSAAAYFYFNSPRSFFRCSTAVRLAMLVLFTLLYIAAAGGGVWSIDGFGGNTKD